MPRERADYQAYLLRLWRDSAQGSWRASLEAPDRSETLAFPDLEALFAFVLTQTAYDEPTDRPNTTLPKED